jgi:uncharacterized protein YndB with AHSA1/START domain
MAHVSGEIVIERPPGIVFDVVADQRNEPRYNPALVTTELLTQGTIGAGTRFRAVHAAGGGSMEMTVELTEYVRPWRIASVTTASWVEIRGAVTFEPAAEGATRMRWSWDVRPKGCAILMTPLAGVIGRRQERACWEGLKRYLEQDRRSPEPTSTQGRRGSR